MMIDRIVNWIKSGSDALEGVQLLTEAGAPSIVLRMVRAAPAANVPFMRRWLCNKYKVTVADDSEAPVDVGFREEFKFLNEPDCPPELEQLASRKFARYHTFVSLHTKLRDCTSIDECCRVSRQLLNAYLENRLIWQELNYYKEHKSIWGKHPIFLAFKRRKDMLQMGVKDLLKRQRQVKDNIWRVKDELKKGDKPHLEMDRLARLHEYEAELAELNRLLGDDA